MAPHRPFRNPAYRRSPLGRSETRPTYFGRRSGPRRIQAVGERRSGPMNISISMLETAWAVRAGRAPSLRTRRCRSTVRSRSRAVERDYPTRVAVAFQGKSGQEIVDQRFFVRTRRRGAKSLIPPLTRRPVRRDHQDVLLYAQHDALFKPALLDDGLGNADSSANCRCAPGQP